MFKELNNCLICGNDNLLNFIDFGQQPLANNHLETYDEPFNTFPLSLNRCNDCGHTQLTVSVDPSLMFKHYLYMTGTSKSILGYYDWFTKHIKERSNGNSVLEIACNDGTLCKILKDNGYDVLGIDPATNLKQYAEEKGIDVVVDFWNEKSAKDINKKFDIIIAQNVLAHVPEPISFMKACKESLTENGKIYIQTSQSEMFKRGEFDTIYHEHLSFFTASSFKKLAEVVGLTITNILKVEVHGTSFVVEFSLKGETSPKLKYCIEYDEYDYNEEYFVKFGLKANNILNDIRSIVNQKRAEGKTVCGFGAAAKGISVLNDGLIQLDFIIDDTPIKQNKFVPGCRTKIVPRSELDKHNDVFIIILPWNFYADINKTIKSMKREGQEIEVFTYFPTIKLEKL